MAGAIRSLISDEAMSTRTKHVGETAAGQDAPRFDLTTLLLLHLWHDVGGALCRPKRRRSAVFCFGVCCEGAVEWPRPRREARRAARAEQER